MPPAKQFPKESILQTAYEIAKNEGMGEINARRIAQELHCSTQPIYHNFDTMDDLKDKVRGKIYGTYMEYMQAGAAEERAYLGMGMAYIRFARDYPNFFNILFMHESGLSPVDYIQSDQMGKEVLNKGQIFSKLTIDQQKDFHAKVWVFTHGLACLMASATVCLTDAEVQELLAVTTRELLIGYQHMLKTEGNINV